MTEAGIRELKNNLAAFLRRAGAGEWFAITRRGKRVAVLGPCVEQGGEVS